MKEIDLKWVLLLALYSEYCKDNGDFNNVRADMIESGDGIETGTFAWTLYKLQTEGYIAGCVFDPPTVSGGKMIRGLLRKNMSMTAKGVDMANRLIEAEEADTEREKRKKIWEKLRDMMLTVGLNVLSNFLYEGMKG